MLIGDNDKISLAYSFIQLYIYI